MHPHFTGEFPPCPKKTQKRQALDPRGSEQIRLGNGLPCPQGTPRTQKMVVKTINKWEFNMVLWE